MVASGIFALPLTISPRLKWLQTIGRNFDLAPVVSIGSPRPINALATTDLYRTGAYPISARPDDLDRNPFYERGVFSVDLRVTKGFEWWKDHGIFLFGVGVYNLTNHTNALRVSQYVRASDVSRPDRNSECAAGAVQLAMGILRLLGLADGSAFLVTYCSDEGL